MKNTLFLTLLAFAVCILGTAAKERPPNVLFIAVDDLNDWVNCMGGRKGVHTPNLDRLAARGALFTNAHCAARGQRYRYVLHPNGAEQLHDHKTDPDEFTNLADKAELEPCKKRLAKWFPKTNAKAVPYK